MEYDEFSSKMNNIDNSEPTIIVSSSKIILPNPHHELGILKDMMALEVIFLRYKGQMFIIRLYFEN